MKHFVQFCALTVLVAAVSISCVGCGGGKGGSATSVAAPSNVQLAEVGNYDQGVTFAAPAGWEEAKRQSSTVVKFDNPNLEGQSVMVKTPKKAEITTLASKEDAAKSGLTGELVQIGNYMWMRKSQRSRDPKTEDKFDNLNCTTVQFGKAFTVTVRGFENQNNGCDAIMNAVLSKIKFSESAAPEAETKIDENTDFSAGLDF